MRTPIAFAGIFIGFLMVFAWLVTRDPVSQNGWDKIREGMTREQVMAILGRPYGYDGAKQIQYSRRFNAGWAEFIFDDKGHLIEKNDESVFVSLDRKSETK